MIATEPKPKWLKQPGAEPLPGYRLLEPLGRGGFGEVWKCEAPGGVLKAIKFVQGNGQANNKNSANLEFQAIQWVKAVRHPFVLSIDRVEILGSEMILVMELADRNLADRFAECREAGKAGIDRDELLAYLCEAAEALDLINFQHGLQHLDIKPANLFIVAGHVKVADFGLVNKVAEGEAGAASKLGGLTPLYVAPELLEGRMSRHSDQYSLAIVYHELLTGTFPFDGDTPAKVMMAHLGGTADLAALPEADRPWVARALAKDPDQRFSSCLHFLQALVSGVEAPSVSVPARASSFRLKAASLTPPAPGLAPRPGSNPANSPQSTVGQQDETRQSTLTPGPDADASEEVEAFEQVSAPGLRSGGAAPPRSLEFGEHLGSDVYGETFKARTADGRWLLARVLPDLVGPHPLDGALLARLSSLRHPALPPLEVVLNEDGRRVFLTDLLGPTLQDRFRECVEDGLVGIHRVELLGHLGEAAAALQAMNRQHRLCHLGLSPRALVLTDDGVQLADFGLAQLLWLPRRDTTGHVARRYAAPELLQGAAPSAACDVYSLALIYAEMLTGIHPWPKRMRSRAGASPAKPDLDWLPAPDRAAIARALDADPRKRFADCEELLDALSCASRPASQTELPAVVPVANLCGAESLAAPPSIEQVVTQIVLAETSADSLATTDRLTYLRRKSRGLEARFPVSVTPSMIHLQLAFFCEQWRAKIVSRNDQQFVLRLRGPQSTWQWCVGSDVGLEIRLNLQPLVGTRGFSSEAVVTVQPFGGLKHSSARNLDEVGPQLLRSLRDSLLTTPDHRCEIRWPCSRDLDVYPVLDEGTGTVGEPLEAKGLDVSFSGLAFLMPRCPTANLAYVDIKTVPEQESLAVLVRIVHVNPISEGGFKVGAAFGLAPASTPAAASAGRVTAVKNAVSPQ